MKSKIGRPFALTGRYFANIFVHFEPHIDVENPSDDDDDETPIYVVPDTPNTLKDIYIEDIDAYDDLDEITPGEHYCTPEGEDCFDELSDSDSYEIEDSDEELSESIDFDDENDTEVDSM